MSHKGYRKGGSHGGRRDYPSPRPYDDGYNNMGNGRDPYRSDPYDTAPAAGRRASSGIILVVMMVGIVVWSLLAWVGYSLADPLLAWLGAAVLGVAEGGRGLAVAVGGQPAGAAMDMVNAGGLAAQAMALLQLLVKPAIVLIWLLGIVALLALPFLLPLARRLASRFR
ncbi:hypothetical protein [Pseudogemmobacter bohemicus]|uniref:hypothetical protein n=1 Tax=Pseudogemmobacter bohemicus TaxID=2250708 RepID=UPI0018E55F0B|nr:hypothetical protein [Pseudogemmobacter bohemicus]